MRIGTVADLAAEVLRRPPRLGGTRLVCVDGPSGAGKTVFAGRLAAALPPPVPVVHTDDLLDGWDDQFTFWPRLEAGVLEPLRAGSPGRYRPYDWRLGRFADEWIEVPPAPVVIVEGVSAARAAVRPLASMTVLVTAPPATRVARSLARDGDALAPYLEIWRRREARHFAADATVTQVDLLVDAAGPHGYRFLPAGLPVRPVDARAGLGHDRRRGSAREPGGGDDDHR